LDFTGPVDVERHHSVPAEFKDSRFVFLGRATGSRNVSSPDDPDGYDWTVYDVEVLETFKGKPTRSIQLVSSNTTARFPMDEGRVYLLFVAQSKEGEWTGKEILPRNWVDNCGNSGPADKSADKVRALRSLEKES
jgi:hypothetical protein